MDVVIIDIKKLRKINIKNKFEANIKMGGAVALSIVDFGTLVGREIM